MLDMERKTKIVCTIGPASGDMHAITGLAKSGMDVARLNFSHGSYATFKKWIKNIRTVSTDTGKHIAILQDLPGPKIRVGDIGKGVVLKDREFIILSPEKADISNHIINITYSGLSRDVKKGNKIFLNDGAIRLSVTGVTGIQVQCRVEHGGPLSSGKGINVPGVILNTPSVTREDLKSLKFGLSHGIDMVAVSFVRSANDIGLIRKKTKDYGYKDIFIVAKIEKHEALTNLEEIIKASDGVMVARGDLGVEIPLADVPIAQRRIVSLSRMYGKPVITATQMLESMIENPLPTRAEVSDVAEAVYQGSDAVMLSAETAIGKYAQESVRIMDDVLTRTAQVLPYKEWLDQGSDNSAVNNIYDAVSVAACSMADKLESPVIVVFSRTGASAIRISRLRPKSRIITFTPSSLIVNRASLWWGVYSMQMKLKQNSTLLIKDAIRYLTRRRLVKNNDSIVFVASSTNSEPGSTNMVEVLKIKKKI